MLQTVFGTDGERILSVSWQRTAKLADTGTGVFLDHGNWLRGKLYGVARHPRSDHVLVGGEGRVPCLATMDRPRSLKIAADSAVVRKSEEQQGKIFALASNPDGSRIAVGGVGAEVPIYGTESGLRVTACGGRAGGIFVGGAHGRRTVLHRRFRRGGAAVSQLWQARQDSNLGPSA